MKKEDLKKVVIHCPTEEEAIQCCELADKLGWKWKDDASYKDYNYWKEYKEGMCYDFHEGYYHHKEWFKSHLYEVKSAQWFLVNFSPEKKNVFVYIRGVEDRGQEVIDTLVKLDGTNHLGLNGTNPNRLYYIASNGTIVYAEDDCSRNSIWVKNHYTEIFLPKEDDKKINKIFTECSTIEMAEEIGHFIMGKGYEGVQNDSYRYCKERFRYALDANEIHGINHIYVGCDGGKIVVSKSKRGLRRRGLKFIEKPRVFKSLLLKAKWLL